MLHLAHVGHGVGDLDEAPVGAAAGDDDEHRRGAGRDDGAMAAPDGSLLGWSVRALAGGRQLVRFRLPTGEVAGPSRDGATPRNRKAIGAD